MTKRKTATYTQEFKESSAKLAVDLDQPIAQTARDLGINETTLYGWVSKLYPKHSEKVSLKVDPHEENKRLRKQLLRVTQERDILKKATAYFASEML
jgi:transposase